MKAFIAITLLFIFEGHLRTTQAALCSTNPCNLATGFGPSEGYNCYNIQGSASDSVCTCPNNVATVNAACRAVATTTVASSTGACNRTCANGGVCNIVNQQTVCQCLLGFSGTFCEIQGLSGQCQTGTCLAGTCFERVIGASRFAYCQCTPGYTGTNCNTCYFQCSAVGVFPDTAYCAIGRYFYCAQASGAPAVAVCPDGLRFNRNTNRCESTYNCT